MADATKIKINLLGDKGTTRSIEVTFPTTEQWLARQKARRIVIRSYGRGASETTVIGGEEADLKLLQDVSGEDGFTTDEASMTLNQLSQAAVENVERESEGYKVSMRTALGPLELIVRPPSAAQIMEYRRKFVRVLDMPYNSQEVRTNMRAAADLFDSLCDGQADLPIIYKVPAVGAVVAELERLLEPSKEDF